MLVTYDKLMMISMDMIIRHYQPSDQDAVFKLSADTAFFGAPVEAFLEDRRLYNDAFVRYYVTYETPYIWIAEGPGGVIGFLLGCINTLYQSRHWRRYIFSHVLVKALSAKYRLGKHTAGFATGMLVGIISGEEIKVDLKNYPAHLQIDVREGYRGKGVGRQLIDAYLEQLRQISVCGVHLETTSYNLAACHLYEKVGFQLLDSRPNRYWTRMLSFEVKNLSYGLKLA